MLAVSIHVSFFFFFKEWNSFYFCNLATQPAKKMNLMHRQPLSQVAYSAKRGFLPWQVLRVASSCLFSRQSRVE